ncbi:tetratricopeptide repeat protein [Microcoleus sp. D2_18a_D3]|uniref:tetratricopeptide repeat protein n=1 Tax=Microcoleus sp. D2_18a_D3 TaxID=3055330 RepID=UPI002FD73955
MTVKLFQQANQLLREGKLEEAIVAYQSAISQNPNFYLAYHNLGETMEKLGRWEEAVEAYRRAVQLKPGAAWSHWGLSQALQQVGRVEEAQQLREKVAKIEPKLVEVRSRLETSLKVQTNRTVETIPCSSVSVDIKKAIQDNESEKNEPDTQFDPEGTEAYCRQITKKLDPLHQYYQKIDHNPNNYLLYLYLGNSLVKQGLLDNAIIFYKIGLKINPDHPELNLQLGKVLIEKKKWERALNYLSKSEHLEPYNFECNVSLGKVFENLGRWDEAILSYKRAYKIQPENYYVIKKLGDVLEEQDKSQEATELYRTIWEMDYAGKSNECSLDSNYKKTVTFNQNVLFALHISPPYDGTGYTIRSHDILKSLRFHNLNVLATTRLGYPQDLPEYQNGSIRDWDQIEEIKYCRLRDSDGQKGRWDLRSYEYIEKYAEGLVTLAHSHQASVIHGVSNFLNGMASVLAARKLGIKSIYEIRGLWYLSRVAKEPNFQNSYWYAYQKMMEATAARQADGVVVISQALKEEVIDWGVDSDRVTVIPNAVDLNRFSPRNPAKHLIEKFNLTGKFVIGFVGSLNVYEGIDILIQGTQDLIGQGYQIALLIVGDGLAQKELQDLAQSNSGKAQIIFTGRLPFSDIPDYYSVCDLCVFPRRNDQVCRYVPPMKVLEPMAMAKPVIVSDLSPLVEMVEDGKTGLVCRCGNVESLKSQILQVYRDREMGNRLGNAAREWVRYYRSWDKVSERYLDVYNSLFARS